MVDPDLITFSQMRYRCKMKFRHRLMVASVTGGLIVVYIILSYTGYLPKLFSTHQEKLQEFIHNNPLPFNIFNGGSSTGQCRADFSVSKGTVTTLDIAERADYNTYLNGLYTIPHAQLEDAAYSKNLPRLNVIILPFTHVDPGWLSTVDEYYMRQVKIILDSMVRKLHLYPDMTFIWAEIVFLSKWWNLQTEIIKQQVQDLVKSGRLEIVSGGWVMPDEASTHYVSVIDQLIEGHQWVIENLGVKPNSSWSIDPFGHSGTMPYIWKKAGMSNMVIGRIHQSTKGRMVMERNLEFTWKQFWSNKDSDGIRCHVMPYMLYTLHQTCGPDKYVCSMFDFRKIPGEAMFHVVQEITEENIANRAKELYEQYRLKASLFQHDTIFIPLGDDFRFDHAEEWDQQYENYKLLMDYMNSQKSFNINMKFGTLRDYFDSVDHSKLKNSLDGKFQSISGDFFPYSDHDKAYWTGYFSTRPFDKRFSREVESRLRAAEIQNALAYGYSTKWNVEYSNKLRVARLLREARENLGLFLHHDAITGTSKSYVVEDYEEKLFIAYNNAADVLASASQFLLTRGKVQTPTPMFEPEQTRSNFKQASMHRKILPSKEGIRVILYNPTGHFRSEFVEFIVDSVNLEILNSKRKTIPFQINPVFSASTEVDRESFEIVFLSEIAAFGVETYTLKIINRTPSSFWSGISIYNSNELIIAPELKFEQQKPRHRGKVYEPIYIENSQIGAEFKSFNGFLNKWIDKSNNKTKETKTILEFKHYLSRGSGAYLFFPSGTATDLVEGVAIVRVIEGPFCTEVQSVFPNLFHRVKLYHHPGLQGRYLFIQNALDMFVVNMRDWEPIMRLSTNVGNQPGNFFTDENGFQFIGRKKHPTDVNTRNIERNYYPVTTMAFIQDDARRITLHTGQAHGAASLDRGQLEMMFERQLLYDDERGLGEGISDNKLTMTKYMLTVEHFDSSIKDEDVYTYPSLQSVVLNEFLNQPIQKMYTNINSEVVAMNFLPLEKPLPCDVFIVGLKTLFKSDYSYNGTSLVLHRKGYHCGFPDNVQCVNSDVDVSSLLPHVSSAGVKETSLTHLEVKSNNVNLKALNLPPMELKSYLIKDKT
ncbi:hypothetical protein ACF0H5_003104 [Mactra antiquata]